MTDGSTTAWRCTLCGYVHQGPKPPDFCPICGADSNDFEPYEEPAGNAQPQPAHQWQCLNCNYVHDGSEAPEICPICGADRARFEALPETGPAEISNTDIGTIVIAGGGVAGVCAAEAARQVAPNADVTLASGEDVLPYYRLNLTRLLAADIDRDALPIHDTRWYADHGIALQLGAEAHHLDTRAGVLTLRNGTEVTYDALVLAMGSHPYVPPIPGTDRDGVSVLRTLDDAHTILAALAEARAFVCIGGGVLGIETAGALAAQGADVTLLESHEWLMPRQLNRAAGERLAVHLRSIGVKLLTQARTREIAGAQRAAAVHLQDGRRVPAGFVIISTGVRPNTFLARRAGLSVNRGVLVDDHLRTSEPTILAAGDLAEHNGSLYGNWAASQFQGRIAGMNAAGADEIFGGIPRSNTLKVLGLPVVSIGQFEPEDGSYTVVEDDADAAYTRFVFRDGCLVGAVMVGAAEAATAAKRAVETGRDMSDLLRQDPTCARTVELLMERCG